MLPPAHEWTIQSVFEFSLTAMICLLKDLFLAIKTFELHIEFATVHQSVERDHSADFSADNAEAVASCFASDHFDNSVKWNNLVINHAADLADIAPDFRRISSIKKALIPCVT